MPETIGHLLRKPQHMFSVLSMILLPDAPMQVRNTLIIINPVHLKRHKVVQSLLFADNMLWSLVQHVGPTPDYELIRSWLGQCDREHMQCRAAVNTEKLASIRLIDVQSQRLVSYIPGVQYVRPASFNIQSIAINA